MPEYMLGSEIKTKILNSLGKGKKGYKEIQEETGVSSPSMNKYLKKLEKEREIGRKEHPKDRRKKIYYLRKDSDYYQQKMLAFFYFVYSRDNAKEAKKRGYCESHLNPWIGDAIVDLLKIQRNPSSVAMTTYLKLINAFLNDAVTVNATREDFQELWEKQKKNLENYPGSPDTLTEIVEDIASSEEEKKRIEELLF